MNRTILAGTFLATMSLPAADLESAGLVAHWTFDRDFASTVNNALYAGVPHGGARIRIDRAAGASRVGAGALRLNSALQKGSPVYVSVKNPPWGLGGNDVLTLTGWFKLSDAGRDGTDTRNFVWETVPNSAMVFSLNTASQGKITQFRFRSGNYRVLQDTTQGPSVPSDTWHHAAQIWNGRARHVRVYINGRLHREMPMNDAEGLEPAYGLHLGGNKLGDGTADWDGWLDDLAIFDVELTAKQIAALAAGGEVSAANVLARVPEPDVQRIVASSRALPAPQVPALESTSQGPFIGHAGESSAILWARIPRAGVYTVTAKSVDGQTVTARARAAAENDWCLHWRLSGLKPRTSYTVTFAPPAGDGPALPSLTFQTAPAAGEPAKVTISFGSCVDFGENPIWTRIADESPDGFVMLGDTPYIDTTKLDAMRWAYRRFASIPTLAAALQRIPFWGTWDDHDFGENAADGTMPNKSISRRIFAEYRPLPHVGENGIGSYTSFRRGPMEVFLLDTRWFARTEPSWSDRTKEGLLGRQQWNWLQRGLRASTAPFKILASGMIWSPKHGTQNDSWGSYAHERDALFRWLGENKISGIVLIGGDIHISRLVKFPSRDTTGYDLTEFISSPMHDRVNPDAAIPNPNVIASVEEPWVFLKVTADSTQADPVLTGELINRDGKRFFRQELKAGDLRRQ
jgi:alkaline phosphatase D